MGTVVDIHTHVYPPSYIKLLEARTVIPYVRAFPPDKTLRLVILPGEDKGEGTSQGRPVGPEYYDITQKIAFMDKHHIDISVISLANPWLDWVPKEQAVSTAKELNDDVEAECEKFPGRLFAFATLPLSGGKEVILEEIKRVKGLKYVRGVIMGTTGLGVGLDDPELLPIFKALDEAKLPVFLHPHYGLPSELWGPQSGSYGHVLPLALGFPMETTIAVTRMILSGVFSKIPELTFILAHSGGTLPFLAGRIESCIRHEAHANIRGAGDPTVWEILKKNIYLDAVIYGDVGLKAAIDVSGGDRVMFGTDHPFFPPVGGDGEEVWESVVTNTKGIDDALGAGSEGAKAALGGNAIRVLRLTI